MPIKTDSLNRELYNLLNSRGYNPISMDADIARAGKTVPPEEADVFKFTFKRGNKAIDDALISVDGSNNLIVYYDEELSKDGELKTPGSEIDDSWFGLLNFLKKWAFSRRLAWELAPKHRVDSDMAQRTYMKKKEQIAEGYYPMGKQASYSDAIPTVKIVLQHSRQIQEGEQRYRNVAKIFLENIHGERILAPTTKPGIAQIYARHLAEGGVPNDERWNHIKSLCEEYSKMAGFVRAVRSNQFNESAQKLVEAGLNHYHSLRESLGKMRGQRGYTAYFESWTPTLMETESDDQPKLNELFVQETLDPRIESVMPILNRLHVNIGEMKEVNELAEWADNLTELAEPAITKDEFREKMSALQKIQMDPHTAKDSMLKKELMRKIAELKSRAKSSGIEVTEDEGRQALNPIGIPENQNLTKRDYSDKSWMTKNNNKPNSLKHKIRDTMKGLKGFVTGKEREMMDRGELDTYQDMQNMRENSTSIDEQNSRSQSIKDLILGMDDNHYPSPARPEWDLQGIDTLKVVYSAADAPTEVFRGEKSGLWTIERDDDYPRGNWVTIAVTEPKHFKQFLDIVYSNNPNTKIFINDKVKQGVAEGIEHWTNSGHKIIANRKTPKGEFVIIQNKNDGKYEIHKFVGPTSTTGYDFVSVHTSPEEMQTAFKKLTSVAEGVDTGEYDARKYTPAKKGEQDKVHAKHRERMQKLRKEMDDEAKKKDVEEGLDANQKRVGQLGPTEKVKNNNIGKLVGANESVNLSEMDSEGYKGHRGDEDSGKGPEKSVKPIKSKDAAKDAENVLNRSMDKAHKKDMKEGQEDLDAILRIIRK